MPPLLDAIIRHQIYLEGLKAGQLRTFLQTSKAIEKDVRAKLLGLNYDTMDGLTKAQLRVLLADLREVSNRHYSAYVISLIKFLQKFMRVDTAIVKGLYAPYADDDSGPADFGALASEDRRWGVLAAAPLPASGALLIPWVRALATAGTGAILLQVNRAYANRASVRDTVAAIVGTSEANGKDGVLGRTNNTARAVINTALQHVSANNQAGIAKILWPRYRWVSVLDDRTTNICRSRDGNIYLYDKGPLPPAHPGCRSSIMPIAAGQDIDKMPTFNEWAKRQPGDILRDMFGTAKPGPSFGAPTPLTLEEFEAKKGRILQDG